MKKAAIAILFDQSGQNVLLVKRKDVSLWVLPGGGIEDHETPEEAVCREVVEETGLKVEILRKVAEYTPINALSKKTHLYICKPIEGKPALSEETSDIAYFPHKKLPSNFFVVHADWLQDALLEDPHILYKPISRVTYWNFCTYALKHPLLVLRFLLNKLLFALDLEKNK